MPFNDDGIMVEKIAIMQPYFMPYAGYFRLFAQSDLFIIYDCVQFPRRGWVHRNKLPDINGNEQWLTMPIEKCDQTTKICNLSFSPNAENQWQKQLKKTSVMENVPKDISAALNNFDVTPVEYIIRLLEKTCNILDLPFNVIRSSTLNTPEEIRSQDRIIAIAEKLGAKKYINAPGGKDLYNNDDFAKHGMELAFLPEYKGNNWSILHRLATEKPEQIRKDIDAAS